jgi:CBS domain-containing protein
MNKLTVRAFMTASPHTVGVDQPLAVARDLMRRFRIRHLPVLRAGELVGLLSERDLGLVELMPGVDTAVVTVEEAMAGAPYTIDAGSSLEWLATDMCQRRADAAVVTDGGHVVGVFTTVDALRALEELLGRARRRRRPAGAKYGTAGSPTSAGARKHPGRGSR